MSDEEDEIIYVKKQKTIHYGSLEETMEQRMKLIRSEAENATPVVPSTQPSAQIPEYFDIDSEM
jgi:hypothetical protein